MRAVTVVICCLMMLSGGAQALETPLVLRPPTGGTDRVVVIEPGLGILTLYSANTQTLQQRGQPHNFLVDLDYLQKFPVPGREELSLLQLGLGQEVNEPTYTQMLDYYGSFPAQRDAEAPTYLQKVRNSEEKFWQGETAPAYDGVVRGAMLDQGLLLVIPSTYTLLLYEIRDDEISLASARNYRMDLYVPQVYQSAPTPQNLLDQLPEDIQLERKEALEQQMEDLGEDAGQVIPISESDPWIAASSNAGQQFVIVDPANKRLLTYRFVSGRHSSLELTSVRNLEIDLMIPTTYQSTPNVAGLVHGYNKFLEHHKMGQVTEDYLLSLTNEIQVSSDEVSNFHAILDPVGLLILNFTDQRQLLTYRTFGSQGGADLISARDYSIEAGIGTHIKLLQQLGRGRQLMDPIENAVRQKDLDRAFALAKIAITWNPWLFRELEQNRTIQRRMGPDERWQPLIEDAAAEVERREAQIRRIQEQAEARERERQERRSNP